MIGVSTIQPSSLLAALRKDTEMGGGDGGEGGVVGGRKGSGKDNHLSDAAELGVVFYTSIYICTHIHTCTLYVHIYAGLNAAVKHIISSFLGTAYCIWSVFLHSQISIEDLVV